MAATPEAQARAQIDRMLEEGGWCVQDYRSVNLGAGLGVAVREVPLSTGPADYLLFIEGRAAGVLEAKRVGATLSGVTTQSEKYQAGSHPALQSTWGSPLPFAYESTGVETQFRDERDPRPRSRRVFAFHRPETLKAWLEQPQTLRARLQALPALRGSAAGGKGGGMGPPPECHKVGTTMAKTKSKKAPGPRSSQPGRGEGGPRGEGGEAGTEC